MHSAFIVLLTIGFLMAFVASFVYIFIDIRISDFLWIMLFVGLELNAHGVHTAISICLLYTSLSPRDRTRSRMPSSA